MLALNLGMELTERGPPSPQQVVRGTNVQTTRHCCKQGDLGWDGVGWIKRGAGCLRSAAGSEARAPCPQSPVLDWETTGGEGYSSSGSSGASPAKTS
jgi:hypothetical protein